MTELSVENILNIDRQHIWHPYSSYPSTQPLFCVKSAEGVYLHLENDVKVIDGMSSWWSTLHGYNHPELNAAAKAQIDKVSHVMFGGLTHEPAARLAQHLVRISPEGLDKVFFSDSGSVAVEVAIKMAMQYWQSQGRGEKNQLLALKKGYHGDTFAAMSVCDPVTGMHHLFEKTLRKHIFADAPKCGIHDEWHEHYFDNFKLNIEQHHSQLAAVILEPIVQGTGGMRFYSPVFLQRVREICNEYDVLLIADEIATGLGRTGKMFACEFSNISPDIMCLGKTLTGGYLSLAATLCTEKVAKTISEGEAGVFMHGPTFMGNPLACSIASKSIELLEAYDWQQKISDLSNWLTSGLEACKNLNAVSDVRVLGAIGVVELKQPVDLNVIQPKLVERGIWLRPFGKLIYMMPPYICEQHHIEKLTSETYHVIQSVYG